MKRIVFYDDIAGAPYSDASLDVGPNGIGGGETAVARVALKLSEAHYVTVAQRHRLESEGAGRLRWIPLAEADDELKRADAIVILRKPRHMITARRFNKDARVFLWYHDWNLPVRSVKPLGRKLQSQVRADLHVALHNLARVTAVGVSGVHAQNIREHLAEARTVGALASKVRVDFVYSPIPDDLGKSDAPYDPTKLVFFSAAWKGIDMVLSAFQVLRRSMPDMRLYLACPGYALGDAAWDRRAAENVSFLGSLPHARVLEEVRSALCVFYPANVFPETYGLVFAESHALGTPVLAHPFGAACEMLRADELVDARNTAAVVERVRSWRDGARPAVSANDLTRLSSVAEAWERLLFATPGPVAHVREAGQPELAVYGS